MELTSKYIHSVMVGKGFWQDVSERKITGEQKILEQLLHMAIETLEWLSENSVYDSSDESSEEKSLFELADVLIVLMDLCGGVGIDVNLNQIRAPVSLSQDCDALASVKNFLDATRKRGEFTQADVESLVSTVYCMYGKVLILTYIEEKMERNIQRPPKYGKMSFKMRLKDASEA